MEENKSTNIVWHHATITRKKREALSGHRGGILWFTGLSGSGKSTLAHAVEDHLHKLGCHTFVLDGDNVRHGLCSDLDFSDESRKENIRRISEVAKLFLEAGIIVLTAFISPFREDREMARKIVPHGDFFEMYCDASLERCEERDVKGLYAMAREGKIPQFTGISSPYEVPKKPELSVDTGEKNLDECVKDVIKFLKHRGVIQQ